MSIATLATRPPVTAPPWVSADDVARLMDERDVGSVVITLAGRPVGIVTDRDLVLRVLRPHRDPLKTRAADVMSSRLECIAADRQPLEALTLMRSRGIRRLPVLGRDRELIGVVTYDDLVQQVGRASADAAEAISGFPVTPRRP
jgi:CBS domain-containing protein